MNELHKEHVKHPGKRSAFPKALLLSCLLALIPSASIVQAADTPSDMIVKTSKEQLGAPYKAGGASPATGFNTTGFVHYTVTEATGASFPKTSTAQKKAGTYVAKSKLKPGDIVFFKGSSSAIPGVYIGNHEFLYAHTTQGVVKRKLKQSYWTKRYLEARRFTPPAKPPVATPTDPLSKQALALVGSSTHPNGTLQGQRFTSGSFVQHVVRETTGATLSRISRNQREFGLSGNRKLLPIQQAKPGDVLFFKGSASEMSGIYLGNNEFVTMGSRNVEKLHLDKKKTTWRKRLIGAVRYDTALLQQATPETYRHSAHPAIREATRYLGVPYRLTGTDLASGFDCSYLVQTVFRDASGIHLPRITYNQHRAGTEQTWATIQPGDTLYFSNTFGATGISHVGIYLGNQMMLHQSAEEKMAAITYLDSSWKNALQKTVTQTGTTGIVRFEDPTAHPLAGTAASLIGTPQATGGSTPAGFDTGGFVRYVYQTAAGITLPETNRDIYEGGTPVAKADLALGDILFFSGSNPAVPIPGIYIGNKQVALVTNTYGVTAIDYEVSAAWSEKYLGAVRYAN